MFYQVVENHVDDGCSLRGACRNLGNGISPGKKTRISFNTAVEKVAVKDFKFGQSRPWISRGGNNKASNIGVILVL